MGREPDLGKAAHQVGQERTLDHAEHPLAQKAEEGQLLIADLADAFAKIEATTRHHAMSDILAELFRKGREDARILPYLLEGRLGPPYSAPDIGTDEHRLAQAIAAATGEPEAEVWRLYKERGDLGLVAEALMPPKGQATTVQEAYSLMLRIARTGSYEEKVALFSDLLRRVGGREARYLVRMAQGRLRLGVGDATIMDGLSVAAVGDRSLRPAIERAYSFCSDLGLVAETLFSAGPDALDRIRTAPGRPVLSALAERLPSPEAITKKLGKVIVEPKYDGLRLQAHKDSDKVWLFTRRLEDVTHALPEVADAVREQVVPRQAVLDGEAVGFDPKTGRFLSFQVTVRRRRKHGVEEMEILYPLRYYVFDLLYQDGEDLTHLPLVERSARLRAAVRESLEGPIFLTPQMVTDDPSELKRFFDEMERRGLEGALVKRPDAPYHAGARRFNWVKLKRGYQEGLAGETFDVVVVGYYRGKGKRAKLGIGSLLTAVYDPRNDRFRTVSRVGSGLTEEEWVQFREMLDAIQTAAKPRRVDSELSPDVWVEPRYVIEVVAGSITRSPRHTCGKIAPKDRGYSLRFPRMSRFRFDRRPEDATTEEEVIQLYHQQTTSESKAA